MKNVTSGLKITVFSLIVVAFFGVIMRYKIAFPFPFFEQKFLQEAHSHFAFYGWVTSCIYFLLIRYLLEKKLEIPIKKYLIICLLNLLASYGMLFSFTYGGYYWLSIFFSTLALLTSFGFFYFLNQDLKTVSDAPKIWFLAGLFFAMISSVGVFTLSYMMASHQFCQELYLATIYYYLHFQYNGFFIFSCIGFLIFSMQEIGIIIPGKTNRALFWLLFLGCFFGFGLSVLWMKLPMWIFIIIALTTILQTVGAIKLCLLVKKNWKVIKGNWSSMQRFVVLYAGFAFMAKILLQLGSNIPEVSHFAFGFRNVVIAYLHLVLLMCVSAFLLGQILGTKLFNFTKILERGLQLFLLSVFLNEFILGIMGVFSIRYIVLPYASEGIFVVSCLILISVLMIFAGLKKKIYQ